MERGLVPSRSRARDLILRGLVAVDGAVVKKPGALVAASHHVSVEGSHAYVSRGALKLEAALDAFGFDVTGRIGLDVGSSTGGFTEVLLARGASKVYAVDVGRDQLHEKLRRDPRVVVLESTDARDITAAMIPDEITALVSDVSFISLEKALPRALERTAKGAILAVLVKPQFEAGRDAIGKGGIVKDQAIRDAQAEKIARWIGSLPGWRVAGVVPSPIEGGSGNQEFLLGAIKDG